MSTEIATEEGGEVKGDEEVEFGVVERADSSLGDDAGPDESSEAKILFTVLRGMWTKPSKKQAEKNNNEDREIADNGDQLLAEKKNTEETEENGRQNPAQREKTKHAKESHDRYSQPLGMRVLKTADLGTLALLVVNSFKLHLTA